MARFDLGLIQGQLRVANLKVPVTRVKIIYTRDLGFETYLWEVMGWESFSVIRFDLWPPSRVRLKCGCVSLNIFCRGWYVSDVLDILLR